jgi:hypothetical protein
MDGGPDDRRQAPRRRLASSLDDASARENLQACAELQERGAGFLEALVKDRS